MADANGRRESLIKDLFRKAYTNKEILTVLWEKYQISLSERHLKRLLKQMGLFRRKSNCSFSELCNIIEIEIHSSGSLLGYRSMQHKLKMLYKVNVSRRTVSKMQQVIDPIGVAERKAKRLKRRKYYAKGPNFIWHLDGYDKLKRFGFCIHGCIDGYSRKLLWLETSSTNNSPKIIAGYYLDLVKCLKGTARFIRADAGSENLNIAAMQRFFNSPFGQQQNSRESFIFGRSTANQRIEAFWSQLRKSFTQWWMNEFKDMSDDGSWDETDPLHRECLKFCFSFPIQKELNMLKTLHNTHRIRRSRNYDTLGGKPDILYETPGEHNTEDFKTDVDEHAISLTDRLAETKPLFHCDENFAELALYYMTENDILFPDNFSEARHLYDELLNFIGTLPLDI